MQQQQHQHSELFTQLQRLSAIQSLMVLLEREQGPPPSTEDNDQLEIDEEQQAQGYLPIAKVLLDSYEKANRLFQKIINNNNSTQEEDSAASSLISAVNTNEHRLALFSALFNIDAHPELNEILENENNEISTLQPQLLESLKQDRDTKQKQLDQQDDDMAIEEEPLLPFDIEEKIFAELQLKLSNLDFKKALTRGIRTMINKQAEEEAKQELEHRQKQIEIERQRMEAFNRSLLLKNVNSNNNNNNNNGDGDQEEFMRSLLGVGISFDDAAGANIDDDDEGNARNVIEIERLDLEPQFLRKMGVNFRRKIEEASRQKKTKEIEMNRMRQEAKRTGKTMRELLNQKEKDLLEKQQRNYEKGIHDNNNDEDAAAATQASGAGAAGELLRHVPSATVGKYNSMEIAFKKRMQSLKEQRRFEFNINNNNHQNNNGGTTNTETVFKKDFGESATAEESGSSLHLTLQKYREKHQQQQQMQQQQMQQGQGQQQQGQYQPPPGWGNINNNNNNNDQALSKRNLIQQQRDNLPIAAHKQQIIDTIKSQRVTVLIGETGSGKTTQLAQYLYDGGFCNPLAGGANNGNNNKNNNNNNNNKRIIACTQPRLIAAKTVAARVSEEFGCKCGEEVGYTVRFDDCTSPLTVMKFMTDGVLLREALMDDSFSKYSVIILDEAHERNLNTDILFALCKKAIAKNPNLTIVATSATLDAEKFCKWWGCEKMLKIEGRTFPVEKIFLQQPCDDYFEEAIATVMKIHMEEKPGDILVFFTGKEEIENGKKRLDRYMESDEVQSRNPPPAPLIVTRLYAGLPDEDKAKALEQPPPFSRKVVLATNIAETSVTIDGLYYVIDCGYHKQNIYNPKTGVDTLAVVPIARSQAKQRAGRAGRTGPGRCYFLYTQQQFWNDMPEAIVPEIQRTNLANVVLTLKAIGFHNILSLDFMDPPPVDALVDALEHLYFLSALDNDGALTSLGSRMSQLPVSPNESRALLTALEFGCLDPVLTIVAMLGESHIFVRPKEKQEEADRARLSFAAAEGDHITLLRVWEACQEQQFSGSWMKMNYLNPNAISRCRELRNQLMGLLKRNLNRDKDVQSMISKQEQERIERLKEIRQQQQQNDNNNRTSASTFNTKYNLTLVRKSLIAGYFYHAARRNPNSPNEYTSLTDKRTIYMPTTSVLFGSSPKFVVYHELLETTKEYMRECIAVDPLWLLEMAPNFFKSPGAGEKTDEQKKKRLDPLLRNWETHGGSNNTWRISKLKPPRKV